VVRNQVEAIEQRDQGLLELSDLTRACLFVATALLAAFSVIAAVTIPGQTTPTDNSANQVANTTQPHQALPAAPVHRSAGHPVAVSGGSH
jgi:hypothetical protein